MNALAATLEIVAVAAAAAYVALLAARAWLTLRRLRADSVRAAPHGVAEGASNTAPITVAQPIFGGDPALHDVLRETLQRTPPWTRFVWLVDDDDHIGQAVVNRLAPFDPRVTVLRCPPPGIDENPKTKKLALALRAVRSPYFAVLDDDTIIGEANLAAALAALGAPSTERVDLYTGLPSYDVLPGVANGLLAHFVNDNASFAYLSLPRRMDALSINGMFYAARTDALRELDAFERIRSELCDDYALARLVRSAGWRIHQGTTTLALRTSLEDMEQYRAQMHRWFVFALVLLRDQPLAVRLALSALLGIPPVLLALVVLGMFSGRVGAETGVAVIVARHLTLGAIQRRVLKSRPGPLPLRSLSLSLVSELSMPLHCIRALLVPVIRWRSRLIRVERDGRYREVSAGREARA